MNTYDKRAQICAMDFIRLDAATVQNLPGAETIHVSGQWVALPISQGEFSEKRVPGDLIEQELKATLTDTGDEMASGLKVSQSVYGLVLLTFTNRSRRVVGTDQFPVLLTLEESGSPAKFTLSFKRNSPEPAKILESF